MRPRSVLPRILVAAITLSLLPLGAAAQGQDGEDTAGAWRNTHFEAFNGWESLCDALGAVERCYLRRVDVYRPRPQFGALFGFLNVTPDGETLALGLEFGTEFGPAEVMAGPWSLEAARCAGDAPCEIDGPALAGLLDALAAGHPMSFAFIDQYGDPQRLLWPADGALRALEATRAAAAERSLAPS